MTGQRYFHMNAAELIDHVFEIYKKGFWTFFAFSALFNVISIASGLGISLLMAVFSIIGSFQYVVIPAVIVLALLWIVTPSVGYMLITQHIYYNEQVKLGDILPKIWPALPRVLSSILAVLLICILPIIVFVCLLLLITKHPSGLFSVFSTATPALITLILFISAIFFIILILLSTVFSLSIPIAIFDRRFFFKAALKSKELIKGAFGMSLGVRWVWILITGLLYYSITVLSSLAIFLMSVFPNTLPTLHDISNNSYAFLISSFFQIAIAPFSGILTMMIYYNQKIVKEGLDIEISIQRLRTTKRNEGSHGQL